MTKSASDVIPEWLAKYILGEVDDGIYIVDTNLNIIAANETVVRWSKTNGYTDSIAGKNVIEVLPFLNETAISHIKEVLDTSKPIRAEYIWPLEQNRVVVAQIVPLLTPDTIPQALTVARDVGEQRKIIDGLIKRELAARLLLEQVNDGIHLYTVEGEIIYANGSLSTQLGYTQDELLKLQPFDIDISLKEANLPPIREELLTQGHLLYETSFVTKDGRKINTEVNSNLVQYYGKDAILCISRDVSERRIVIDDLDIYSIKGQLERSNRDLELYTSLLQHDLRRDLQVVLAQADLSKIEPLANEREVKSLKVIQAAIDRMSKLLDMLQTTREIAEQELESCIRATASQARNMNPDLHIEMVNNTGNDPIRVSAGRLLPLVWTNLFRNAVSFAGPEASIQVTISSNLEKVIVEVTDDGPGVSDDIKMHLFEKGASTTGSGYGLYLCRKIVEAYGGTIELINQEKRGAQFRVSLLHA